MNCSKAMLNYTQKTMHIALLTEGIHPLTIGGMPKHAYNLAKYLAQSGVRVTVFYPQSPNAGELPHHFSAQELTHLEFVAVHYPSSAKFPLHYLYNMYRYSKNVYAALKPSIANIDFVYVEGFAGWYTLKTGTKIPIATHFHGFEGFQPAADLKSYLAEQILVPFIGYNLKKSDYVFSLGGNITKIIREKLGIAPTKILEIPIGIDHKQFEQNNAKAQNKPIKFVFVGRYSRRKGIQELCTVLNQLIAAQIEFEFLFIGPIPEPLQIKHPNIRYTGALSDEKKIFELLFAADVLVCPSYAEGMPTVILEAMASQCAILATDVGAINELVNPQTGWLITHGNTDVLYKKMCEIIQTDPLTLQQKQKAALALVNQKFTWQKVMQQTVAMLQNTTKTING